MKEQAAFLSINTQDILRENAAYHIRQDAVMAEIKLSAHPVGFIGPYPI